MIYTFLKKISRLKSNSRSYYPRYYYDEKLMEHYKDLSEYFRIITLIESKTSLKTNEIIAITEKQIFNPIKKKAIIKKYKQPHFKYKIQKKNLKIEIYLYKMYLGGYRVKLEIHMYENKLFYYNYTFRSNITNQQKQEIIKIIQDKYLQDCLLDESKQNIIDENQTILQIENSLELKIHYMNAMDNVVQVMNIYKKYQEKEKYKNLWKKREELIQRL